MEPFSITCPTCRARLKVSNEAAIGQILACPKCGSMVQVNAPSTAVAEPRAAADETSRASDDTVGMPDDRFSNEQLSGEQFEEQDFAETIADSSLAAAGEEEAFAPEALHRHAVPAAAAVSDEPAPNPAAPWESDSTRQVRQWLAIGVISVAAAIVVIVLLGLWFSRSDRQQPNIADADPNAGDGQGDSDASAADRSSGDSTDNRREPEDNGAGASSNTAETSDGGTGGAEIDGVDTRNTTPQDSSSTGGSSTNGGPTDSGPTDGQPTNRQPGTDGSDSVDAAGGDVTATDAADPAGDGSDTGSSQPHKPDSPFKVFSTFDGLLEPVATLDEETEAELARVRWDLVPIPQRLGADVPPWAKPPKLDSAISGQLKVEIDGIQLEEMELSQLLDFLSLMTTLPITVDPHSYFRDQLSGTTLDAWEAENLTVQQLLARVATMLELEVHTVDRCVVLGGAREPLVRSYDVTDLLEGETDTADKFSLGVQLIVARSTWEMYGGAGKITTRENFLDVEQTLAVHFEIARFIERLRLAREKPVKGLVDNAFATLEPRIRPALPRLATPVTVQVARPTPLPRILRQLSDPAGVEVLIDWPELLRYGWNHQTKGTFRCEDELFGKALSRLLAPLDLSYIIVNESTVVVTSVEQAENHIDVELYSVAGLEPENLRQRLFDQVRPILGDRLIDPTSGFTLIFDDVSFTVMIAAPQRHQAEIAQTLARMEAMDKAKRAASE